MKSAQLLKVIILVCVSSELAARSASRNLLIVDATVTTNNESAVLTNETSKEQQIATATNSVSSSSMRVGTQSNELGASAASISGVGSVTDLIVAEQKDAREARQDQANAIPTTTSDHYRHASNHQNYPIEPYPSASYTTLVHSASGPTTTATSSTSGHQNQASISALLNRDHHQSIGHYKQPSDYNDGNTISGNSYGNQVFANKHSDDNDNQIFNHNYGGASLSSLNAGLIQNLTASLFPVKQLSNATLFSLSELLNKTRQATTTYSNTSPTVSNGYKPNYNLASYSNSNGYIQSAHQPSQSSSSNYLDTILNDQQFNLFDYIRQPSNQFGFREPSSMARFQSPSSNKNRLTSTNQNNFQHQNAYSKTPSNIYNTYMPYKDNQQQNNNLNSVPTMTNGQALKMAATLYDSYLDQSGYKYPLVMNDLKDTTGTHSLADFHHSPSNRANGNPARNAVQSYQFIQHHSSNNGNHLDKVVYHSTPFRPSIVSPPTLSLLQSSSNNSTGSSGTKSSQNQSQSQNQQRPKTESDNKSAAYASLVAPSSAISDNHQSDFVTNGPAANVSKFSQKEAQRQIKSTSQLDTNQNLNNNQQHHSDFDFDHPQQKHLATLNSTSANEYDRLSRNLSISVPTVSTSKLQTSAQTTSGSPQPPLSAPQMLFDLYEREIDNQIREALYNDHYSHFHRHHQQTQATNPILAAAPTSHSGWPLDDATIEPSLLAGWPRGPNGLGGSSYSRPATSSSQLSATTSLAQQQQPTDPLTAALQELPTFSASDLQPIVPNGPAYSLIPTASQHEGLAEMPLTSLGSQLFPIGPMHHSAFGLFDGDNDFAVQPTSSTNVNTNTESVQAQATATSPSSSPSQVAGLPAILLKFNSGQISSIFTSPFAHLYANLPRYRYGKAKQQQHASQQQQQSSSSSPVGSFLAPSSLISKQFWNAINGAMATNTQENSQNKVTSNISKQQAAAVAAASAAANLIAASGHPLTPLQVALIQAQAATSAYLNSDPLVTEHSMHQSSGSPDSAQTNHNAQTSPQQPQASIGSLVGGLAGGGISPLMWRGVFSPVHWARKQTLSGQNNSNQHNSDGSHQSQATSDATGATSRPAPFPLIHSLWGTNNLAFGQLFSPPASSSIQTAATTNLAQQKQTKARLKIKILKIPVAVYDSSPSSASASSSDSQLMGQMGLMPAHLQPNPMASLLANLPCTLHNHQLAASSTTSLPAVALGRPFFPAPQAQLTGTPAGGPMSPLLAPAPSQQASSPHPATMSTPTTTGNEKAFQMQYFTDINQPNDLQVSPTRTQGKLMKLLNAK